MEQLAQQNDVVAVLLGAGASADAGIPTTVGMTDEIMRRIGTPIHHRLLKFVRHTLEADSAARNQAVVDVERLFTAVELLIDRLDQPWSPFVDTWSSRLDLFVSNRRAGGLRSDLRDFERQMSQLIKKFASDSRGVRTPSGSDIVAALADGLDRALMRTPSREVNALLRAVRAEMLRSLYDVLRIADASSVDYLAPLVELARRQGGLTVATLNYDRSVEELAARHSIACDTGIETWLKSGQLEWPSAGLRLLKLHGSIDWAVEPTREQGALPLRTITTASAPAGDTRFEPAVIFGETGKLTAEGPFLELLLA